MKIERYTRQKNGQYKLNLDNHTSIMLHEDLILKYNLLINKEVNDDDIERLLEENTSYIAYDFALNYLKSRMRTKKEVEDYLMKKLVNKKLIDNVIDTLVKQGYLNDDLYAKSFIQDKIHLSNDGPYKIKEQLLKLGISNDTIDKNILTFHREIEEEKINKIVEKQIKMNRTKSGYLLKRKLIDYLTNLGYSKELVIKKVNMIKVDDSDILKKEYDKVYQKLSKKYSGKELEYKVKQKMYQKGFYNEY